MIALRHPKNGNSGKTIAGTMQVTSGKYEGLKLCFTNGSLYIWGHNLSKASLMYNIKAEDEFMAEIRENPDSKPCSIKKAWIGGVEMKEPATPGKNRMLCT